MDTIINRFKLGYLCICLVLLAGGCDQSAPPTDEKTTEPEQQNQVADQEIPWNPRREAYFGDLHVHTAVSFDSYNFGTRSTPDDAYRYAKGEAISHPSDFPIRLKGGPLDFYAVTDHAEYLGIPAVLADTSNSLSAHPLGKLIRSSDPDQILAGLLAFGTALSTGEPIPDLDAEQVIRSAWQANIDAAKRHNNPGQFTTFIGYEYSTSPNGASLHRNVIFAGNQVPGLPFGTVESPNPEDLWRWMDIQRAGGADSLAIPHNSNWSQGLMFDRTYWNGAPIDNAYAKLRLRNEPLVEITQVKGTSETHPSLSPNDEWAGFEIIGQTKTEIKDGELHIEKLTNQSGSFARDALLTGLELEETGGNPYQLGFIGSTDTHDSASPVEEDQYFGKIGINDGTAEARGTVPRTTPRKGLQGLQSDTRDWGASGLVGVWAESNTRASIFAALKRKEVFATSGPRIRLRFFAGYDSLTPNTDMHNLIERAAENGIPMGGDLTGVNTGVSPRFLVWAQRDMREAWLDRAQIIKGWRADGQSHEQVFDVACSDGAVPDATTHRCPDNGATVNLSTCSFSVGRGDVELKTLWQDPTFDSQQSAFYYLRVLQNPTCRWSTWDAIRAGIAPNAKTPATIQERAWSSPIWYHRTESASKQ